MRAQLSAPTRPLTGPVEVSLEFVLPRPKAHLRAGGALKATAPARPLSHRSGDVDNYAKAALDVMTEVGYWVDDSQVYRLVTVKRFPNAGEDAGLLGYLWLMPATDVQGPRNSR